MPIKPRGRQPYRKEAPVFFHLSRSWLAMAWAGILGESNRNKAEFHVQQWRQHVKGT